MLRKGRYHARLFNQRLSTNARKQKKRTIPLRNRFFRTRTTPVASLHYLYITTLWVKRRWLGDFNVEQWNSLSRMQLGITNKDLFDQDLFSKKICFEIIIYYVTYAVLDFISCGVDIYFHLCFCLCYCFVVVVYFFAKNFFCSKKINI